MKCINTPVLLNHLMSEKRIITCPNCLNQIDPDTPIQVVTRGKPRFKWWVAPLNLLFLSIMLYFIDNAVRDLYPELFPWSIWAISGIWMMYFLGLALTYRTDDAWIIVPVFFTLLDIFLASIDWYIGSDQVLLLGLSWSFYPIIILTVLFIILPLVTFMGREKKSELTVLEEIIHLEEELNGE